MHALTSFWAYGNLVQAISTKGLVESIEFVVDASDDYVS